MSHILLQYPNARTSPLLSSATRKQHIEQALGRRPSLFLASPSMAHDGLTMADQASITARACRCPWLLCVCSEALSAARASALLCAGIGGLRGSAALQVASSVMIGVSIEGYLASGARCRGHPSVVSEKGSAHGG